MEHTFEERDYYVRVLGAKNAIKARSCCTFRILPNSHKICKNGTKKALAILFNTHLIPPSPSLHVHQIPENPKMSDRESLLGTPSHESSSRPRIVTFDDSSPLGAAIARQMECDAVETPAEVTEVEAYIRDEKAEIAAVRTRHIPLCATFRKPTPPLPQPSHDGVYVVPIGGPPVPRGVRALQPDAACYTTGLHSKKDVVRHLPQPVGREGRAGEMLHAAWYEARTVGYPEAVFRQGGRRQRGV